VQLLPGIGGKGADKLWRTFGQEAQSPKSKVQSPKSGAGNQEPVGESQKPEPAEVCAFRLQSCASTVPKKAEVAWAQFVATVAQLEHKDTRDDASAMIRLVLDAGYDEHLKENYANYKSRLEDVQQLAIFAQNFTSVEQFLTELALLTTIEAEDNQLASTDDERVRLSTIHQAKGLEFDVVFVIMMCDGLFPAQRSLKVPANEEEERRLFYVAITRARNELYLSYPLIRATPGGLGDSRQRPSRFLNEIPSAFLEEWNLRQYG
jgi:DNA helicase-2/ATP-dependent DNA helicase PcrA